MRCYSHPVRWSVQLLVILLWGVIVHPANSAPMPQFHRDVVGTIPWGAPPLGMPEPVQCAGECEEGDCREALITFAASDSVLGLYDACQHLLTTVRLAKGRVIATRIAPGPTFMDRQPWIMDGCASEAGTVYLLAYQSGDGARIYSLAPESTAWTAGALIPNRLTPDSTTGTFWNHSIALEPGHPETVVVFARTRDASPALIVASDGKLLPPDEMRTLPAGVRTGTGAVWRSARDNMWLIPKRGEVVDLSGRWGPLIGVDRAGNAYMRVYRPNPDGNIDGYYQRLSVGAVVTAWSHAPPYFGCSSFVQLKLREMLLPDGSFFLCVCLEKGLRIEHWSVR